jgi:DUF4097 and DUF4098 domain-containing protein YvlB
MRNNNETILRLVLCAFLMLLSGCDQASDADPLHKVNGSVHVAAGAAPNSANTVNGSIDIDDRAEVTEATTVNGGIHVGANATVTSLNTVNGGVVVGAGTRVAKNIELVNGGISLSDGTEVLGSVTNVNGKIALHSAHVGGGIKTVDGDILIYGASHVEGGIHVQKSSGIQLISSVPHVEIGPGATVQGELKFEREVKLYVSDRANIGPVTGATAIPFTGDAAPQD